MSAERDAWVEEMRQETRHLRAQLEAATQQLHALASERDAARGALRLALRVGRQLADSCYRLSQREHSEITWAQRAALSLLCREWDTVGEAARKVLP